MRHYNNIESFYSFLAKKSARLLLINRIIDSIEVLCWAYVFSIISAGQASTLIPCLILIVIFFAHFIKVALTKYKAPPSLEQFKACIDIENQSLREDLYQSKSIGPKLSTITQNMLLNINNINKTFLIKSFGRLLTISLLTFTFHHFFFSSFQSKAANAFSKIAQQDPKFHIQVTKGSKNIKSSKPYQLSSSTKHTLDVVENNSIRIYGQLGSNSSISPAISLHRFMPNGEVGEVIYDFKIRTNSDKNGSFSIEITATEPSAIIIPMLDDSQSLADIIVEKQPTPEVKLIWKNRYQLEDDKTWLDDRELNLNVVASGHNALQRLDVFVLVDGKTHKELVSKVLTKNRHEISVNHELLLTNYINKDYTEVVLYASATDYSNPVPLTGESQPIHLKVESAYGRYTASLKLLKKVSTALVRLQGKWDKQNIQAITKDFATAHRKSTDSPFYDFIDRSELKKFQLSINSLDSKTKKNAIYTLNSQLSDFIEEHNILNDRERDRDYFIAVRTISRLIVLPSNERLTSVSQYVSGLSDFLIKRRERWLKRVSFLPDSYKPKNYQKYLEKNIFTKDLDSIIKQDRREKIDQNLRKITSHTRKYQEWIESLEKAEDRYRASKKAKKQQALTQSRQMIRELRERQEKISTGLDPTYTADSKLEDNWHYLRFEQNTNIKATAKVAVQARRQIPEVYEKLMLAKEHMETTKSSAGSKDFSSAETASDQAGRLLRLADQAASRLQQKQRQQNNRRRRRRATGDQYFGNAPVGGDVELKRDYEVDKIYRSDILEQVLDIPADQSQEAILDNYLREITR